MIYQQGVVFPILITINNNEPDRDKKKWSYQLTKVRKATIGDKHKELIIRYNLRLC